MKILKNGNGFTLIEMIVVIAIIVILSTLIMTQIQNHVPRAKIAKAQRDVGTLTQVTTIFEMDNGQSPVRKDKTTKEYFYLLFTADENGDLVMEDEQGNDKSASGALDVAAIPALRRDNAVFHLLLNSREYAVAKNIQGIRSGWDGAYLDTLPLDPWGNSYLMYLRPLWDSNATMTEPNGAIVRQKAWVISAGPNRLLETDLTTDYLLQGDDIGVIIK